LSNEAVSTNNQKLEEIKEQPHLTSGDQNQSKTFNKQESNTKDASTNNPKNNNQVLTNNAGQELTDD
jgi:hypothetical protein